MPNSKVGKKAFDHYVRARHLKNTGSVPENSLAREIILALVEVVDLRFHRQGLQPIWTIFAKNL